MVKIYTLRLKSGATAVVNLYEFSSITRNKWCDLSTMSMKISNEYWDAKFNTQDIYSIDNKEKKKLMKVLETIS